jgi:hypothetical protein
MRGLVVWMALVGCSARDQIALDYRLMGLNLADLVRVETYVGVDPKDPRMFFADQPFRSLAQGVGYEVGDFEHTGQRKVRITHDATLGYVFQPSFVFTLLPPAGEAAPPLLVSARAVGASDLIGRVDDLPTHFAQAARLTVTLTDQRCGGVACAGDETCCTSQCINTLSDVANCGACGMACDTRGDSCQGGGCLCAGGTPCGGTSSCCGGLGCVDVMADPFNCGGCGNTCNPGETCSGGVCSCNGSPACAAGGLCCAGSGCSSNGSCPCGTQPCMAPNVCCDAAQGICVDLMNDGGNCGACGHACTAGLTCQNGACKCNGQICAAGDTCCSTGCANLMSSTENCGSCGHACVTNEVCTAGICKCGGATCMANETCCGTACKDLMNDAQNCGACGNTCGASETCVSGTCICMGTSPARGCTAGETCCVAAGPSTTGGCFDLSSDHNHCGSCTMPCSSTQQCITGICQQTGCSPPCTNGNTCDANTVTCLCGGNAGCTDPNFCCGTSCVDKMNDPRNCGGCNNDVRPNLCCGGHATPNDELNCGMCGTACTAAQFCCRVNGNFTCVQNDAKNCGGCDTKCPPADRPLAISCCACGRTGSCQITCPACAGGPL